MALETLQILTYSVCTSVLHQVYYKPSVQKMFCFSSRLQIHALGDYMRVQMQNQLNPFLMNSYICITFINLIIISPNTFGLF